MSDPRRRQGSGWIRRGKERFAFHSEERKRQRFAEEARGLAPNAHQLNVNALIGGNGGAGNF